SVYRSVPHQGRGSCEDALWGSLSAIRSEVRIGDQLGEGTHPPKGLRALGRLLLDEAQAEAGHQRLSAIRSPELLVDLGDVGLCRRLADEELARDLRHAQA